MSKYALIATLAVTFTATALAQQRIPAPYLRGVYPPAAKPGDTLELAILPGLWLEGADRLVFSHPGITATQVMRKADKFYPEPRPVEDRFTVAVGSSVPAGVYEVRAAVGGRLSNPRKFHVESGNFALEKEPNDKPDKANEVAGNGVIYGAFERGYDHFRIKLTRGQRVLVDCQAERIDSLGDAVLTISDASGRELAKSQNVTGRDPVIDFTALADGEYVVCVFDLTYTGEGESAGTPYRLVLDSSPWIEFADPPIVPRATTAQVALYGRNLGGQPSEVMLHGQPLEKVVVSIAAPADLAMQPVAADLQLHPTTGAMDFLGYRHVGSGGTSNLTAIAIADVPLVAEREPNDTTETPQPVELPCDIVGHFDKPGDIDRYLIKAKKGDKLWVEVVSHQLGASTAPLVSIVRTTRDDKGKIKLTDFQALERPRREFFELRMPLDIEDPAMLWTVPADGDYLFTVKDSFGTSQGGPQRAYWLRVGPPRPDFRALALVDSEVNSETNQMMRSRAGLVRRAGGIEVLIVALRREGYDGEITVSPDALPPGLTAEPIVIGPSQHLGQLVIRAAADAPAFSGPVKLTAKGNVGEADVMRPVRAIEVTAQNQNPNVVVPARLTDSITLSVDDTLTVPAHIEESQRQAWRMARGGKLEIPVTLVKHDPNFAAGVNVKPIGVPRGINPNNFTLGGGTLEGKLTLDVSQEVVPGKFTLHLRGETEVNYRRNIAQSEQADKDRDRLTQLQQQSQQTEGQARQMREQAESKARETEGQRNQANEVVQRGEAQSKQFAEEAKAAADRAAVAKTAFDDAAKRADEAAAAVNAATDEAAKQTAQATAQQAAQQAAQAKAEYENFERQSTEKATQLKTTADELAKAKTALDEMEKAFAEAQKAREQMQKMEAEAQKDRQLTERLRNEAEQSANRWRNIAQQQSYRIPIQSTPIAVEIVPYPIAVKLTPSATTVVAGDKMMLAAEITREFGFAEEVTFSIRPPEGFEGPPYFEPVNKIEKGQNAAQLPLIIQPNSKPGEYTFEVRVQMNFNGRGLEQFLPLRLSIQPKHQP